MRLFTVGIAILGTAIAVQAPAAEVDKQTKAAKKERVVCRTMMVTGTRFEKRTCKTAAEWEEQAEKAKESWREQLARPHSPPDLKG